MRRIIKHTFALAILCLAVGASAQPAKADPIILGQVDTFQTGPEGWHSGGGPGGLPITPLPVAGGGPAGAGDNFLSVTSTGAAGPGSRLSAINTDQWAGDYIAGGVTSITMNVNNFGPSDLHLRLLFVAFGSMGPTDAAFTAAVIVPAGGGWTTATFLIGPSNLTALLGTATGALTNAGELRLFHNPDPFFSPGQNPAIAATLGVDNITATSVTAAAVPEPATLVLLGTGLAGVVGAARRRRKAGNS